MNFQIAIPSYQRPTKLKQQTLAYLKSQEVDFNKVTVFLKNQEEFDAYSQEISGVKMVICNNKSLGEKRTFINKYYPLGERIVSFDDDIKEVVFLNKDQKLIPFIHQMFDLTEKEEASLWGIHPVYSSNMFYNKDRVAVGLQYIISSFWGFINKQLEFNPIYVESEDEWLSLYLYRLEGKTLRYEGACAKTKYFSTGGLCDVRRTVDIAALKHKLQEEFPDLCRFKIKKNGRPDVVFKRRPRKMIPLFGGYQN